MVSAQTTRLPLPGVAVEKHQRREQRDDDGDEYGDDDDFHGGLDDSMMRPKDTPDEDVR